MIYKNSWISIIVFLLCFISCQSNTSFNAPTKNSDGVLFINSRVCYFNDVDSIEKKLQIKIDLPTEREIEEINTIMSYVGLPQNFKIYRGDIDNAMATMVNNQRLIIYNKDLFATIDDIDSSYWSSLFIIAHEIGHHLAYNISDTSNSINSELEADIFAGSILYKMGADSNQAISAVNSRFISNLTDTKTHPSKSRRIFAIKESWLEAAKLRYQSAIPPPPDDDEAFSDEFFEQELYTVEQIFGPLNTHSENISKNVEGIILDINRYQDTDENGEKTVDTEIQVLVTKIDSANNNLELALNQKLNLRVAFHSNIYRQRDFNLFLKGGRRFIFDVIRVRPLIEYLIAVKSSE